MIRASLEPGGNSDNTSGLSSSSSRRKCRVCVTIETTSLEGSTESLGGEVGREEEAGREEEGRQRGICSISALNPSPPLHSFILRPLTTGMRLSTHLLTELLYSMIIGSRGQSSGSRGPQ